MESRNLEEGSYKKYEKIQGAPSIIIDNQIIEALEKEYKGKKYKLLKQDIINYFTNLELREELLQGKTILDIGAANNLFDQYCERKYGATVTAIDNEEEYLGKQHPHGVVADARSLPFADASFDLIISHASMPHVLIPQYDGNKALTKIEGDTREKAINDVLSVFREEYRTLKPGGHIRMTTFSLQEVMSHLADRARNKIKPYITKTSLNMMARIDLIKEAIEKFEQESGARVIYKGDTNSALIIISKA